MKISTVHLTNRDMNSVQYTFVFFNFNKFTILPKYTRNCTEKEIAFIILLIDELCGYKAVPHSPH